MKFRKKPVVIEAEQYRFRETMPDGLCTLAHDGKWGGPHVHTLEGTSYEVQDGDWIITGVAGEKYPCKDEIFKQTYEPAE